MRAVDQYIVVGATGHLNLWGKTSFLNKKKSVVKMAGQGYF